MSKVDFYVLPSSGDDARHVFACRLAEKAYRLEHKVHVHLSDANAARRFDDRLWTFRDGSFVPHEIASPEAAESPVTIGHGTLPKQAADLLINLTAELPGSTDAFPRIAEIVTSDDGSLRLSRKRYSEYRELGHELESHKL